MSIPEMKIINRHVFTIIRVGCPSTFHKRWALDLPIAILLNFFKLTSAVTKVLFCSSSVASVVF